MNIMNVLAGINKTQGQNINNDPLIFVLKILRHGIDKISTGKSAMLKFGNYRTASNFRS